MSLSGTIVNNEEKLARCRMGGVHPRNRLSRTDDGEGDGGGAVPV